MRIGELSAKTGVSNRLLRYYEEQGLVTARRLANGYREYDEYLVDRVRQIRGLLDAGVPTRIISDMLPCLNKGPEILVTDPDPQLRKMLITQRDKMTERIAFLEHNRDALHCYIEAMDAAEAPSPAGPR